MAAGRSQVILNLHVNRAAGLSSKDIFGYSDPYVVINIENRNIGVPWEPSSRSIKTKTCKKTLDPVWNEHFTLKFDPVEEFVVLDVFDENRITRDDFLGRVILTQEYLATVESRRTVHCLLQKRSERSNVSGTILLEIDFSNPGSVISNNEEQDHEEDERFKRMFYQIIEKDNLHGQLSVISSGGSERLRVRQGGRRQVRIKLHRERNELVLPYTTDYQILRKLILEFFFDSENIIEGNFQEAFKGALEKAFLERVMIIRLKEKLNIQRRSELRQIELKLECETGGVHCEIRYISKYRTLILPTTAWQSDPVSTSLENQIEQIFADLKDWSMEGISEQWTEDYWASVDQESEHQLSITRGQFGEEGPTLPPGWEWRRDQNGRILYIDHNNQRTTFNRPQVASAPEPEALPDMNMGKASFRRVISHEDESQWVPQSNSQAIMSQLSLDLAVLPDGWEEKVLPNGKIFYVDHNSKITTWEDPRFSMTGIG